MDSFARQVPVESRYPFFTEMLWYALDRYVDVLTGKSQMPPNDDEDVGNAAAVANEANVHVTRKEVDALKAIISYLNQLPREKKVYPALLADPATLVRDVSRVVKDHEKDDEGLAITGRPLLVWPDELAALRESD